MRRRATMARIMADIMAIKTTRTMKNICVRKCPTVPLASPDVRRWRTPTLTRVSRMLLIDCAKSVLRIPKSVAPTVMVITWWRWKNSQKPMANTFENRREVKFLPWSVSSKSRCQLCSLFEILLNTFSTNNASIFTHPVLFIGKNKEPKNSSTTIISTSIRTTKMQRIRIRTKMATTTTTIITMERTGDTRIKMSNGLLDLNAPTMVTASPWRSFMTMHACTPRRIWASSRCWALSPIVVICNPISAYLAPWRYVFFCMIRDAVKQHLESDSNVYRLFRFYFIF